MWYWLVWVIGGPGFWFFIGDVLALIFGTKSWRVRGVTWKEWVELLSAAWFTGLIWNCLFLNIWAVIFIRRTWWWYLPYLTYSLLDPIPTNGGRQSMWWRKWSGFHAYANYFPVSLLKDDPKAKYPADRPYLFCYHPHGVFAISGTVCVGTDARNLSSLLPDIRIFPSTIPFCLCLPFLREWIIPMGSVSVKKSSLEAVLSRGDSIAIFVGGAAEAAVAKPETHKLVVNRTGFIRLAFKYGAGLVPTFAFNETSLHKQWSSTNAIPFSGQISKFFKRHLGFTTPLFRGRGFFQQSYGFLPYKIPITTVLGKPIMVPQKENPTDEEVEQVRLQYLKALTDIFERNKERYLKNPTKHKLEFISSAEE